MLIANKIDGIKGDELFQKSIKPKIRKLSKTRKLSKFQKLANSKKILKSRNLLNFSTKEAGPSFLTSSTRKAFN